MALKFTGGKAVSTDDGFDEAQVAKMDVRNNAYHLLGRASDANDPNKWKNPKVRALVTEVDAIIQRAMSDVMSKIDKLDMVGR